MNCNISKDGCLGLKVAIRESTKRVNEGIERMNAIIEADSSTDIIAESFIVVYKEQLDIIEVGKKELIKCGCEV